MKRVASMAAAMAAMAEGVGHVASTPQAVGFVAGWPLRHRAASATTTLGCAGRFHSMSISPPALPPISTSRTPLIDVLKGMACIAIVWHHLAFYGPMSDIAQPLAPAVLAWLYDYGRMAVQVFLVLGGYLAASSLAPLARLGQMSYSVFLVHFCVCLLVNAVVSVLWPQSPVVNALGMLLAFALSLAAGRMLYLRVERHTPRWPTALRWQMGLVGTGMLVLASADWA